jgi:hypothetical protein
LLTAARRTRAAARPTAAANWRGRWSSLSEHAAASAGTAPWLGEATLSHHAQSRGLRCLTASACCTRRMYSAVSRPQ